MLCRRRSDDTSLVSWLSEDLPMGSGTQARHVFDLRFWGAFMAAKYGSSQIRPGGSIVLTSGIAGRRPRKGLTVLIQWQELQMQYLDMEELTDVASALNG